jgi:hypothetical protein
MIEENKKASTLIQRGFLQYDVQRHRQIKIAAIFVWCFVLLWEGHYIKGTAAHRTVCLYPAA